MAGPTNFAPLALAAIRSQLSTLALELGFDALGVAELDLTQDEQHLLEWLEQGCHGDMN
jgi:epoxyqueuosine reductase